MPWADRWRRSRARETVRELRVRRSSTWIDIRRDRMRLWRGRCERPKLGKLVSLRTFRCRPGVPSAIALMLALIAGGAEAQEETIVRVVSSKGALEDRLSAELSTLGFDVKDVE